MKLFPYTRYGYVKMFHVKHFVCNIGNPPQHLVVEI